MKRVLILCLHRPDRSPSQRFRFEQYLNFLSQNGYEFDFSYLLNEEEDRVYYQKGKYAQKAAIVLKSTLLRFKNILTSKKYDLVFVQREAFMLGTAFFETAIAKKVPMIFDFDDAIWLHNISEANKNLSFLKDTTKTDKITKSAALVFAGNQYLANYAKKFNPNVVIVPATIDTEIYQRPVQDKNGTLCIGWSGSFSTVQHFALAIPALKQIKAKYGDKIKFKIIGDPNYYCEELDTQGMKWQSTTEVQDVAEIDIGIMPLPDDEWAKGKCGLKGLQYMSLGIPTLMSPVGVNSEIIQNGQNGFLPNNEEDWVTYLSLLIEDGNLRNKIGGAGQRTVQDKYSVEAWKNTYLKYFNQLTS
jgi:glycosyltransferase involved in cell wall biosynthesis